MEAVSAGVVAAMVPLVYLAAAVAASRRWPLALSWRVSHAAAMLAVGAAGLAGLLHGWDAVAGARDAGPAAPAAAARVTLAAVERATKMPRWKGQRSRSSSPHATPSW